MALGALAEQQATHACYDDTLAAESISAAQEFAGRILGADAARLLSWEAVTPEGNELYAARADLPDTPGWYLRWAGDGEEDTPLALHRPCVEGGHRDLVKDLVGLGGYLATLAER
ncbi:hypothetical protein [Kitasatospora cineracea]|uniref:hypothetical protein n=1 Tax=Kitasatospora cineracea TaxID=88074 RepID=UPI0036A637AD